MRDKMTPMDPLDDLREDLACIDALAADAAAQIDEQVRILAHRAGASPGAAVEYVASRARAVVGELGKMRASLSDILNETNLQETPEEHIARLTSEKRNFSETLRVIYGEVGWLLSADNWQSPSFDYSLRSRAGSQTGSIEAGINDYKRDTHPDADAYAQSFVREYVDAWMRPAPAAVVTSSGMSAFTTALHYLLAQRQTPTVLMGSGSYFQNLIVAKDLFGGRLHLVDDFDTDGIVQAAKEIRPDIVILSSLCNDSEMRWCDLASVLPAIVRALPSRAGILLDNTGMATMFQPLKHVPRFQQNKVLIAESLLKYYQFGFDRANAGIIWSPNVPQHDLMRARMNCGSIISDTACLSLPSPHRKLLDARLKRIGRNNRMMAERLNAALQESPGKIITGVVYPSLPGYTGLAWSMRHSFQGGSFVLRFAQDAQNKKTYARFIDRVIALAAKRCVDIVGGTSFGFDTTRIYLTAPYNDGTTSSFVRVSVGTETVPEVERLSDVLLEACRA